MFAGNPFQPYADTPETIRGKERLRYFLTREQPHLHTKVYWDSWSLAVGGVGDEPQATVAEALRQAPNSGVELCALLNSDAGKIVLTALAWEFPGPTYQVLFALLPEAAKLICDERRRDAWSGIATLAGLGLLLYAASRK